METTIVYWGYIGIMENKMETASVYRGYIGTMEHNMEPTILGSKDTWASSWRGARHALISD